MKKMKRILALILCVCMVAACWPAEATKAEEDATTSDISTYYLNDEKATVYTSNYFSTEEKYNSAMGTYYGHTYALPWTATTLKTSKDAVYNAIFSGLQKEYIGNNLQNYTVTAHVQSTQTSGNVAVMAYSSSAKTDCSSNTGYEFMLIGNNTQQFRLNRRVNGSASVLAGPIDVTIPFPSYTSGKLLIMSIHVVTNTDGNVVLNCYANFGGETKVIFENIEDNSEQKLLAGAPGIKLNRKNATITKLSVVDDNNSCLYEDDFSVKRKYQNALGENTSGVTWSEGALSNTDTTNMERNAIFCGILQNYTVGATVTANQAGGYVGVMAYSTSASTTSGNTFGYEFCVLNGTHFRLLRRLGDQQQTPDGASNKSITGTFPEYTNDKEITLYIEARTQVATDGELVPILNCYANFDGTTELIYENIVDTSDDRILSGAPGLKANKNNMEFSKLSVAVKETNAENIIYQDDFSYTHSFDEALSEESFQYGNNYVLNDGKLSIPSGTRISLLKGIDNYAALNNYTAEADFVFPAYDGESDIFNAIMVYGSGSGTTSTGYEFGIRKNKFRLFRRGNNETLCGDNDLNKVSVWFDNYKDEEEQEITLSLTAMTNTEKNGVTLICKATYKGDEKTIFTTTDTSANRITCGTAGLRGTTVNGTVDNFCVKSEEDIYDVSLYRSEEVKTYPSKEGKVFAGWYTDENFNKESALSKTETTGWAYAKFVDEDVLSVKAQLDAKTTTASDTETTRMRFVTTVDCLDYDEVGFIVSTKKKTETYKSTTVYSTLLAQGLEVPYTPEDISSDSEYFATMILGSLAAATEADLNKVFTVTPFWVTADGTTVNGITRDAENNPITILAGIDANNKNSNSSSPYSLR